MAAKQVAREIGYAKPDGRAIEMNAVVSGSMLAVIQVDSFPHQLSAFSFHGVYLSP